MEPSSSQILRPGSNCEGIYSVGSTGLLVDVRDYYRAFYEAAEKAEAFLYIAGWQFDSNVELLRGHDVRGGRDEVRLLPFLRRLCEKKPWLSIRILAWDFSALFALEREWFQDWIFSWGGNSGIAFRFDSSHAIGGSHHQKFAVVDGSVAFVGGADICSNRWDDRRHQVNNRYRVGCDGKPYGPYHDIHSYHTGEVAGRLTALFQQRWSAAGGESFTPPANRNHGDLYGHGLSLAASQVAISRTLPRTLISPEPTISEIRNLYVDAIHSARCLIYIENQYFSSHAVHTALVSRMHQEEGSRLQIVLVLPKKPEALREEFTLGAAQMNMLAELREAARRTGHALGIYYVALPAGEGGEAAVYIHSKLLLVDDRFLTVGSANTTNRSMGLDTELNVSWEAGPSDKRLASSIRRVRTSLLMEHTGFHDPVRRVKLRRVEGLVDYLDTLAATPGSRLRRHTLSLFEGKEWIGSFAPETTVFDPEKPLVEENVFETLSGDGLTVFTKGISDLDSWVQAKSRNQAGATLVKKEKHAAVPSDNHRATILFWVMLVVVALLMTAFIFLAIRFLSPESYLSLPPTR